MKYNYSGELKSVFKALSEVRKARGYDSATKERIVDFAQLKIKIDGADHVVSGGAMVPGTSYAAVRELLELLGYEVGWDAAAKAVMVKSGGMDTGSAIVSKELGG